MARQTISALQPGEPVNSIFMVAESSLRTARNGSSYLSLVLADCTGKMTGRLWDVSEMVADTIHADDLVHIKGKTESYRNELQLNIRTITRADTEGLQLRDFLKASERDADEMMQELKGLLEKVEDVDYRALLNAFLEDEAFCKAFRTSPAATRNHHAYLAGLLEHTLSMTHLAEKFFEHYGCLRRDILLTSVFLHDIGKVRELSSRRSFQYTTAGQLVGHIMLGVLMLEERAQTLSDFPEDKLHLLRHLILSHHGKLEFGSPKLPMCAEAIALHCLDNIDAKLKEFDELLASDQNSDSEFTNYQPLFGTRLYKL